MRWLVAVAIIAAGALTNVGPANAQNRSFCATNSGISSHECLFDNLAQCQQDLNGTGAEWCDLNPSLQDKPGHSFQSESTGPQPQAPNW
jgi:hypothetical protein